MEDSGERQERAAHFSAVTGTPEDFAQTFLEDHGWNLEASVNAYMALLSDDGPALPASSAAPSSSANESMVGAGGNMKMGVGDFEEDLALIQAIARSARGEEGQAMEEDDDDASGPPAGAAAQPEPSTGEPGSSNGSRKGSARPSNMMLLDEGGPVVEVFRNFAAEGMAVPQSVMPQSRSSVQDHGMESMFPPPADLMYHGSFDTLRRDAEEQQKYCLINIQKTDVFDSHALNRDTWKDESVGLLVRSSFVFWQQQHASIAGQQYLSLYPSMDLPKVDIVDPMTGALLDSFVGYKCAEDMVERLSRFRENLKIFTDFKNYQNRRLAHLGQNGQIDSNSTIFGPLSGTGYMSQYHAIDGPGGADKRSRMSLENEDHALDAAIAASLQETTPPDGCIDEDSARVRRQRSESIPHTAYSDSLRVAQEMEFLQALEQDQEKDSIRARQEEEERMDKAIEESREEEIRRVLREKEDSLPPEPAPGTPGMAILKLRLPDGSNKQRRFMGSDKLKSVLDFMHINGADPALHTVATSFPRKVLEDEDKTLEELGCCPQMMLNVEGK